MRLKHLPSGYWQSCLLQLFLTALPIRSKQLTFSGEDFVIDNVFFLMQFNNLMLQNQSRRMIVKLKLDEERYLKQGPEEGGCGLPH